MQQIHTEDAIHMLLKTYCRIYTVSVGGSAFSG